MAITDKFMHASSGTRPEPTTLTGSKAVGASTLTADDLTGWATDTPTPFVLYQIDGSGNEVDGTRSDWVGIVSGNTITQLTLTAGTDDIYPAGSAVIAAPTAEWGDRVVDGLLVTHNQDGSLKDNIVTTAKVNNSTVTPPKLSDMDWFKYIPAPAYSSTVSGTWNVVVFNTVNFNPATYVLRNNGALNDEVSYKFVLQAGTYTVSLYADRDVNRGIVQAKVDGVNIGSTLDMYAGTRVTTSYDVLATGLSVPTSKLITFNLKMTGKNASSSGYNISHYAILFRRTA
jgi:hypothetical protein